MTGFESIKDQEQPIRILTAYLNTGKIPHALLLTGSDGVGKRSAATAFALACNCIGNRGHAGANDGAFGGVLKDGVHVTADGAAACGQCRSCKKILAGSHPDVIRLSPDGQFIRVAQIRELLHILAMKPYEARVRVIIISDAHTMNPEAGNALLKILEEPPERTILVLTAHGTADLLPTLVSRCRRVRFNPLSRQSLSALLIENEAIDPETAAVISALADGSYGRALRLLRQDWFPHRNRLIDAGGLLETTASARRPLPVLMALTARLVENKNRLVEAMDMLSTLYRDLAVAKYRRGPLMNEDLTPRITCCADQMSEKEILFRCAAIETARKHIKANANARLVTERLLLRLTGHLPAASDSGLIQS